MNSQKIINNLVNYWRPLVIGLLALLVLGGLLWFRLGSLPGGISQSEGRLLTQLQSHQISGRSLLDDPVNLPHSLVLYVLQQVGLTSIKSLRALSTLVAMVVALAFYMLLLKWHTARVALLATVLFVVSSWFLTTARYGGNEILQALLIVFFFAGIWLQHSRHRGKLMTLLVLSIGLILYVPGMIWFVVLGGIWQRRRLQKELARVPIGLWLALALTTLLLLAPLLWAGINDRSVLKAILGFPVTLPSYQQFFSNLVSIPRQLFISGVNDPAVGLPGLPLLDIFSLAMFIIGGSWYASRFQLDRTAVITVVFLIGSLLIGLGGPVTIALLMPFVYLIVAAGLTYMLSQWFVVFPRNPLARTIGTSLVTIAVLLAAFYHMNRYYIAWPNAKQTQAAYQQQP